MIVCQGVEGGMLIASLNIKLPLAKPSLGTDRQLHDKFHLIICVEHISIFNEGVYINMFNIPS